MSNRSFAAIITTHGRPDSINTRKTLERCGYTGRVVFLLDDEDKSIDRYRAAFPNDEVVTFCKQEWMRKVDTFQNTVDPRAVTYARNAAFEVAAKLGLECFVQLDDDYTVFLHRVDAEGRYLTALTVKRLDDVFDAMVDFLYESGADCVALAQGGDFFRGGDTPLLWRMSRKLMNSFFCRTDRPIEFPGLMNEDVTAYVQHGSRGRLFATVGQVQLNQQQTQAKAGGMTDIYLSRGTYVKSFMSVMSNPSSVRVALMGTTNPRLHHSIDWPFTVPEIVSQTVRKP